MSISWSLSSEVTDFQFKLGLAFGGSDVLQTLQAGKEGLIPLGLQAQGFQD